MSPPKCSIRWTDDSEKTVCVRRKDGIDHQVPFDLLLDGLATPPDADVVVRVESGPKLLSTLVDLREAGTISGLTVRSWDRASHTRVGVVDAATIRAWETSRLAGNHPVIRKMSPFLPCGSIDALCSLLGAIFDPRWYADPEHPHRMARLESWLQLSPRWDSELIEGPRYVVAACWSMHGTKKPICGPQDYFGRLARRFSEAGYGAVKTFRKVCRHFLRALLAAWMDSYSEALPGERLGDRMFVPELLFDREALEASRGCNG